jgi:hypothetical protein
MRKIKKGEYVEKPRGFRFYDVDTGEDVGILTGSVGLYGSSTGIFATMKTTAIAEVAEIVNSWAAEKIGNITTYPETGERSIP